MKTGKYKKIVVIIAILVFMSSMAIADSATPNDLNPIVNDVEDSGEDSEEATEVDTDWVYDETNSINQGTIDYITELNNNELKDYQYAVYVVDSLNGESMDNYKRKVFNEYGVGTQDLNSGILFVLAAEDREYGVEIGDGISGGLRRQLERDFVVNVAINELKSGDWDGAVYQVSNHVGKLIRNVSAENDALSLNVGDSMSWGKLMSAILLAIFSIFGSFAIFDYMQSPSRKFFKTEEFKNYVNEHYFDLDEVKSDFKSGDYNFNQKGCYLHLVNAITHNLTDRGFGINNTEVKWIYKETNFDYDKGRKFNITILSDGIYEKHLEEERKRNERIAINNQWIAEICEDGINQGVYYDNDITRSLRASMANLSVATRKEFALIFNKKYREMKIAKQIKEMFPEFNSREVDDILKQIKSRKEYNDYIHGFSDKFEPDFQDIDNSPYYSRAQIGDISHKNSRDIWFWLWIYSKNQNRMYKKKEIEREERIRLDRERRRRADEKRRREAAQSRPNNFGSGFGGGSSSGGGFSGKF